MNLTNFFPSICWHTHFERQYCYFDETEHLSFNSNINKQNTINLLPHLVAVQFSDKDAKTFLQGQLSVDLNKLNQQPLGCYCSRKGRVISIYYIYKSYESYIVILPKEIVETFIKQIKRYVVINKVKIKPLAGLVCSLSKSLFDSLEISSNVSGAAYHAHQQVLTFIDEESFEDFAKTVKNKQVTLQGDWLWHKQQIQNNIPSIYTETMGKFLPHDISLHKLNALDFEKGCYIGQEIVARMHFKAKLKNHLALNKTTGDRPSPGVGTIIDCLSSSADEHLILSIEKI